MLLLIIIFGSLVFLGDSQSSKPKILAHIPPTLLDKESSESSCFSQSIMDEIDKERRKTREILNNNYRLRPCKCGGPGWTRVLFLDMTDSGNSCPSNWTLHDTPVRGCGRKSTNGLSCDSVIIPVTNINYSLICGRIYAYQRGESYAFGGSYVSFTEYGVGLSNKINNNVTIEDSYVSGLSLTHGAIGARKHVWTFSGAYDESPTDVYTNIPTFYYTCPCINAIYTQADQTPSYVGESYFCDTGAHSSNLQNDYNRVFMDDPLWDGEGCSWFSTCCSIKNPPWFCKNLQYHTTDDLELRLCSFGEKFYEDKLISLVEIYVK